MTLRDVSKHLEEFGIVRSHVAIHNWVHAADLQPPSTVTALQLAVDEKATRINGRDYWLYAAVAPDTNEFLHVRLFPTTTNQATRWFLADLYRRYTLDGVTFLVDNAHYLVEVLRDDGYDFEVMRHGPRNAIGRVSREVQRRTSSFTNSFSNVAPATAESWLDAFADYHNARQT